VRLKKKLGFALLGALAVFGLFWFIRFYVTEQLQTSNQIIERFSNLKNQSTLLEEEVLKLQISTFPDYDALNQRIIDWQQGFEDLTQVLSHSPQKHHGPPALDQIQINFNQGVALLRSFQTLNSTLKNSTIYIPTLAQDIALEPKNGPLLPIILFMVDKVALANNLGQIEELSMLMQAVSEIENRVQKSRLKNDEIANYLNHIRIFTAQFPLYLELNRQMEIQNQRVMEQLLVALNQFRAEDQRALARIKGLSAVLFVFLLLAEGLLILLIIKNDQAALRDRLTGLKNRLAFLQQVDLFENPAMILIDLNGFKNVNNFYGIQGGDHVLKGFAKRLRDRFRAEAQVFRISGDEFALLFEEKDLALLEQAVAKVNALVTEPFYYKELPIQINLNQAICDQKPLLTHCNMVMKHLKEQNDQHFLVYSPELGLEKKVAKNFELLEKLKKAIRQDRIQPVFQPIFDRKTLKPVKFECLIRLVEEDGTLLSPYFFLDIAKRANLYRRLTEIMIEKCFARFEKLSYGFSINLSAQDITDPALAQMILGRLEKNPELAARTTFEILESEGIDNFDLVQEFISSAKSYGAQIAIDDFGAGYSNFENILKLQVDYLKIDGSLIKRIDEDINSERVTRSILWFAHEIGIKTVVEFVHSKPVMDKVIELGADLLQGFYLGAPELEIP